MEKLVQFEHTPDGPNRIVVRCSVATLPPVSAEASIEEAEDVRTRQHCDSVAAALAAAAGRCDLVVRR